MSCCYYLLSLPSSLLYIITFRIIRTMPWYIQQHGEFCYVRPGSIQIMPYLSTLVCPLLIMNTISPDWSTPAKTFFLYLGRILNQCLHSDKNVAKSCTNFSRCELEPVPPCLQKCLFPPQLLNTEISHPSHNSKQYFGKTWSLSYPHGRKVNFLPWQKLKSVFSTWQKPDLWLLQYLVMFWWDKEPYFWMLIELQYTMYQILDLDGWQMLDWFQFC